MLLFFVFVFLYSAPSSGIYFRFALNKYLIIIIISFFDMYNDYNRVQHPHQHWSASELLNKDSMHIYIKNAITLAQIFQHNLKTRVIFNEEVEN